MGRLFSLLYDTKFRIDFLNRMGLLKNDKTFLKMRYKYETGHRLNLKNPQRYNEKLQWLKLYDRRPEYTNMVDKYEVKRIVEEKIGADYIIPTLGIYNTFDEIDFDALPSSFVLKCTHDSGSVILCKDKAHFDKESAREKLTAALKKNFYEAFREWPYKNVKPRIIAEQYMQNAAGTDLEDYKVMCFNGEPKIINLHKDRYHNHTQSFYTSEWKYLDLSQKGFASTQTYTPPHHY